jgi:hypothetical protein
MTHLPNEAALKMDGAQACRLYPADAVDWRRHQVGGRGGWSEVRVRTLINQPLVQILVVVAIIQMRSLKTEVGKGSV